MVDMRKKRRPHRPLHIWELEVERVRRFKYLGVHISDDLTSWFSTQLVKRAQQWLYFLRRLRKFGMSPEILSNFYSWIVESIFTGCINVWYGSTSALDRKCLQIVVETAEKITRLRRPLCRASTTTESTGKLSPSSKTPSTPSTDCSHFCPQAGGPRPPDLITLSSPLPSNSR